MAITVPKAEDRLDLIAFLSTLIATAGVSQTPSVATGPVLRPAPMPAIGKMPHQASNITSCLGFACAVRHRVGQ